jgi:D-alanine-D-alanine ligase
MSQRRLRVALLMGGQSAEREVSLNTGRMIARFLDPARYEVLPLEIAADGRWLVESPALREIVAAGYGVIEPALVRYASPTAAPLERNLDVVFLALHGPFGEDGTIQGMLELLGLPYTCSGVLASALAMDKARMKAFARGLGITTARDRLVTQTEFDQDREKVLAELAMLSEKLVVKPNRLGSSVAIRIVETPADLLSALEEVLRLGQEPLVEEFVSGVEVTAPVLGNDKLETLPLIEIVPNLGSFYDYRSKYTQGGSEHIIPARLAPAMSRRIQDQAAEIHAKLGCRGVTRSDFIVRGDQVYFLEINTIPGMTATSLVPQAAEHAGYSFSGLLDRLIELALDGRDQRG